MKHFRPLLVALAAAGGGPTAVAQNLPQPVPAVAFIGRGQTPTTTADPAKVDAAALKSAGLRADDPAGLIEYLRQRTLSDADLAKIRTVIRRMGDENFEERVRAGEEVEKFGAAAVAPLRTAAQSDPDPEVAFRAEETLRRMEKVSHADVALAVVRALAASKPPAAPPALLAYLPLADTHAVEDEIRTALVGMAARDGAPDPALVAALDDPSPVRRGAAAVALIEGGPAGNPVHLPGAYARVKAVLKTEVDPETRFRILNAMLTTARDGDAVAGLIDLIPVVNRGRVWQIEDYLIQLAGKAPPKVRLGTGKEALEKGRDGWRAWWEGAKASTHLTAFEYRPKTTGRLLLVSMDARGWGNAKIAELGPDLKERWKIRKLNAPVDCRVLANGRVMVMEQNNLRLTEWDPNLPDPLVSRNLQAPPVGFQALPNGHTLVVFRHMIAEYDKEWKQPVNSFTRGQSDILAAHKLPNGQVLVLCQNPGSILRLDDKWKELPNPVRIGQPFWQPRLEVLSEDRVLVTEQSRVVEYDLKALDKREVWKVQANAPSSVQRLSNGNTLIVESTTNQVKEVGPEGEVVWTYTPADGMRVMRAERR